MPNVYCVRGAGGKYADAFKKGGYVAIRWLNDWDLGEISRDNIELLYNWYREAYPGDVDMRRAINVGQMVRFLFDVHERDIVLTPSEQREKIYAGTVIGPYYHEVTDDCPYAHRRRIEWRPEPLLRSAFSVPLQNTLGALATVYNVRHASEVLEALGYPVEEPQGSKVEKDMATLALERILRLSPQEFEQLVTELLSSLGFEEAEQVGKVGDGGVDVTGTLRVSTLASVNLTIQVKRYKRTSTINAKTIRDFRGAAPAASEAAFVTTARFNKKAREEAIKPGFKKIGLVDGNQLVDLLAAHYENLSEELQDKLHLRLALVIE